MSIGVAARRTGCSVPTIRYYESVGLLVPAARTLAGQRSYTEADVRRLAFVRRCRDFGFSIDEIRALASLAAAPDRPCSEVRDIAAMHLAQVREKLADLQALERDLGAFVSSCESACAGGTTPDCTILEGLAQPDPGGARGQGPACCVRSA